MVYHLGMPAVGPSCPRCRERGSAFRVPMKRAYVRLNDDGKRQLAPIGWFCTLCSRLYGNDRGPARIEETRV